MTNLRVAIVAETFLPEINGVTNSVRRVARHLRDRGHEVLIVAPAPGPHRHDDIAVERVAAMSLPGYPTLAVGLPRVDRVRRILADFEPDVVHLAAPVMLGAAGVQAARSLGIPTVAVFQTDLAGFARRYHFGAASSTIWAWLRSVHRRADLTLAPSTHTLWELRRRGIGDVRLWGRGVDATRFDPAHRCDRLRLSWGAGSDTVVVGYMGRLAHEKGLPALRHLSGLANTKLVVIGDGPARPMLETQLPGARFLGFQDGHELARSVASLDVFVHPGAAETFCQAVQEALASGVPAVVPAAGGPVDLVRHGSNGFLFPPAEPELMRGAVEMLARDPSMRRRFGVAARAAVEGRTWAGVGDELIGHYGDAMARRGRSPQPQPTIVATSTVASPSDSDLSLSRAS